MRLVGLRIGCPDLPAALAGYGTLLEASGTTLPDGTVRFRLARGEVDVTRGGSGPVALRFAAEWEAPSVLDADGVAVHVEPPADAAAPPATPVAIDHVVVHTTRPERAIARWHDRLGLRLALDRTFSERGLRLLFFRSGGMTLEYAAPLRAPEDAGARDRLWGVAYRVPDLARHCARLRAAGIEVSPSRPGVRPGTTVATVRSGTCGVPTLLLELAGPEHRSRASTTTPPLDDVRGPGPSGKR